jgi:hypothetical protein
MNGGTHSSNGMHRPAHQAPHTVLGVPCGADHGTIKRAYRQLALRYHPDLDPSPGAAHRFRAVHAAYRALMATTPGQAGSRPHVASEPGRTAAKRWVTRVEREPTAQERFLFRALHATGLCFSVALITTVIAIIVITDRSQFNLLLALPGFVILPDSIEGLRR